MLSDFTALDSMAHEALKNALNRRVVVNGVKLMPSAVNRVWIVETDVRPVIVKRFFSGKAGVEFETLLRARSKGLAVPLPYWRDGEYVVEEYVEGEGCGRLINQMFRSDTAEMIGTWLAEFHSALREDDVCLVVGDVGLEDFISSEGRVFCVDLEDAGPGDPIEDLGGISARILGSEPFFTPIKFELCNRLISSYERAAGAQAKESVRSHISRRLRADARRKPLFRRTLIAAAKALDRGWPELAP